MKSNDSTTLGRGRTFQRQRQARMSLARWLVLAVVSSLMIWSLPPFPVQADAGDLDPTFGIGGRVMTNFGPESEAALGIAIQGDGKIVTAGVSYYGGQSSDILLVRYHANGSLDPSFGSGGRVTTNFSNLGPDVAHTIAIQPDGKFVVAGYSGSRSDGIVARYSSDGSLDLNFGSGGKVICPIGELGNVVIRPDGKIVVAGSSFGLARLNSDGSFDTSFGSGGIVSGISNVSTPSGDAVPLSWRGGLAIQEDGKMVEAGLADLPGTCSALSALARYNPDGTPDSSFGSGGWVFTSFGPSSEAHDVVIQPDGKILAAGVTRPDCLNPGMSDFALARYNTDGSLDASFGTGGKVSTDLSSADEQSALVVQPNGRLYLSGSPFLPRTLSGMEATWQSFAIIPMGL